MDRSSSRGSGGAGRGRGGSGGGGGCRVGGGGRGGGGRGRGRDPSQAYANPTNPPPVQPDPAEGGGASRVAGPTRPESSGAGGRRTWAGGDVVAASSFGIEFCYIFFFVDCFYKPCPDAGLHVFPLRRPHCRTTEVPKPNASEGVCA